AWTKLQSITHEGDLQEILYTAELAGTEFTAERLNISVITPESKSGHNPYLLTPEQESAARKTHESMKERLTVPRRPDWDESTTAEQLQAAERESFLDWRRGLAELQEEHGLLLTPFERNLEVWRQLWRVIERSDVIVQIVDARHPLFFRSTDLEQYVQDIDPRKKNLLLVNKADMLTRDQRQQWADFFASQGIRFSFFSAALAKRKNEEDELASTVDEQRQLELKLKMATLDDGDNLLLDEDNRLTDADLQTADTDGSSDDPLRILTTSDLLDLFTSVCPEPIRKDGRNGNRITVGLVGYPNVGKSSTINALCGSKRVSVSATPGKTKHFQTINLTDEVMLCDCPGLVFPSFATTQAEMVCNGVLPIDQLRESSAPSTLVAQRVPKELIERIYGIRVKVYDEHETGRVVPTGDELCKAYALARGFMRQGQGNPDESRAARHLLKDYVKGKLVFVHPPPTFSGT
ncbi:P-loop containing nucleoside triphosphate hydrolase protein, partial [Catenaria anguillulae PL171]